MSTERFVRACQLPAPAADVFAWHTRPGALERLTPPWAKVTVVERNGTVTDGGRIVLRMRIAGMPIRWQLRHCDYTPGREFRDVQLSGPFARWSHTHRVEPRGEQDCELIDAIEYALPGGMSSRLPGLGFVERKLAQLFDFRHELMRHEFSHTLNSSSRQTMKVLVSGSSGLVGSTLIPLLSARGNQVRRLVRRRDDAPDHVYWKPDAGEIDRAQLEGLDAVVHLAGESIATGRWTEKQKQRIRDSRVQGTRLLAETLTTLERPPKSLICASAIGYYGDRGDEVVDEDSAAGRGFLADVCQAWEQAALPAQQAGIRVVNLRFGVVLSPAGGALAEMLLPFRLGLGGRIGNGRQYMSWISIEDAAEAIYHAVGDERLRGPVNAVTPNPVTNREFTRTLGKVLHRPTVFPVPAAAARLMLGQMADELLLASTRVRPKRLQEAGYVFRHAELEPALRAVLGR